MDRIFNLLLPDDLDGMPFLGVPDAVLVADTVYPVTAAAHQTLLSTMTEKGYALNADKTLARLSDSIDAQMCDHCDGIIESKGLGCHGHKCEHCHGPTMLKYNDGEYIAFKFVRNMVPQGDTIAFRINGYDTEKQELLLHPDPLLEPNDKFKNFVVFQISEEDEALRLLQSVEDLYERRAKFHANGEQCNVIAIKHSDPSVYDDSSVINTVEITGVKKSFTYVKIFNGQVYDGMGVLPVPEHIRIDTKYIDHKLSLAHPLAHEIIMRAAGQSPKADTYWQDGRPAFDDQQFRRWDGFVKYCVDVPYDEWENFRSMAPHDGPGFIYALAKWCADMSNGQPRVVRDDPNFMNAINSAANMASGGEVGYAEGVAAADGMIELGKQFDQMVSPDDVAKKGILRSVVDIMSKRSTPLGDMQGLKRKKDDPEPT